LETDKIPRFRHCNTATIPLPLDATPKGSDTLGNGKARDITTVVLRAIFRNIIEIVTVLEDDSIAPDLQMMLDSLFHKEA